MEYTYEQKLELANKVRSSNKNNKLSIPESYEAYLDKVDVKECHLATSHGETHYYKIQNKNKSTIAPLIVNVHGGGFCQGHQKRDIVFSSMLAVETGSVVLDIDYKLAPEYPFPITFDECYDLTKWASDNADELGIDKSKITLIGHSSGANIVAAVAMKVTKTKDFEVKLQIMDYPPTDLYTDPAEKPGAPENPAIPFERARAFNSLYTNTREEAKNPYVSMVFATSDMLKGMPDALVITGGLDQLHQEAEKYAFMMMEAGVKVTIKRYLNSNHGFIVYFKGDEWPDAHKLIINTINSYK